jgi:mRNA interferase RelE/StbE
MYTLKISRNADKDLDSLPQSIRTNVMRKINALPNNPRPSGVKKLKGEDHHYRIRIGNYRVVYEIKDDILFILVIRIRHRKEAY